MTTMATKTAADLLVELDRLGIQATLKGERIGLQPASRLPADMLARVRDLKPELTALLTEPRRRWQEQTLTLLATVAGEEVREDLQHAFQEREAVGSVDGGLDDHQAGRLAYETLIAHLKEIF
jgi:hypothetical protein